MRAWRRQSRESEPLFETGGGQEKRSQSPFLIVAEQETKQKKEEEESSKEKEKRYVSGQLRKKKGKGAQGRDQLSTHTTTSK